MCPLYFLLPVFCKFHFVLIFFNSVQLWMGLFICSSLSAASKGFRWLHLLQSPQEGPQIHQSYGRFLHRPDTSVGMMSASLPPRRKQASCVPGPLQRDTQWHSLAFNSLQHPFQGARSEDITWPQGRGARMSDTNRSCPKQEVNSISNMMKISGPVFRRPGTASLTHSTSHHKSGVITGAFKPCQSCDNCLV
jgi:hypothetical protein